RRRDVDLVESLQEDIVAPFFVHKGGSRIARPAHVAHRLQGFEIQRDRSRDVLSLGARPRHAHGDKLAHMSHLADRKHRLLRYLETGQAGYRADRLDLSEIRRHEDDVAIAIGYVNGPDAGMRQRAAHKGNVLKAWQPDVSHVLATPAQEAIVLT